MPRTDVENIKRELREVKTIEELDRHLEEAGGIELSDEIFVIYVDEYDSRGWSLPQ